MVLFPSLGSLVMVLLKLEAWRRCVDIGTIASSLYTKPRIVMQLLSKLSKSVHVDSDCVSVVEPISLVLSSVKLGVSESYIARFLDWKMFEEFAASALVEAGYNVYRNIRVKDDKGVFEIDVLGVRDALGIVVECKHWQPKYTAPSRLRSVALRHVDKMRRLAANWRGLGIGVFVEGVRLVPVILVLREYNVPVFVNGVVVVPASKLKGFLYSVDEIMFDENITVVKLK